MVGAVPGVLKARFGAHEVIVTIMLNFIVLALLNYIVATHLHVPETLHTPEINAGACRGCPTCLAVVPRLGGQRDVLLIALAAVAATSVVPLFRTRAGFELRAVGPAAGRRGIRRRARRQRLVPTLMLVAARSRASAA